MPLAGAPLKIGLQFLFRKSQRLALLLRLYLLRRQMWLAARGHQRLLHLCFYRFAFPTTRHIQLAVYSLSIPYDAAASATVAAANPSLCIFTRAAWSNRVLHEN